MKNYRKTLSASTLTKDPVVDPRGKKIGALKEIMIDVVSGRIAYLVISFGGFLSIGEKLFAFPYEAVKIDEDAKQIIVDTTEEKLEKTPGFDPDNWPDESKFDLRELYDFYQLKPYWDSDLSNPEMKNEKFGKENMENEGNRNG